MNLYEVLNGYEGFAYVRVYVWAHDDAEARKLASAAFDASGEYGVTDPQKLDVTHCFAADAAPFATLPSSEGWWTEDSAKGSTLKPFQP